MKRITLIRHAKSSRTTPSRTDFDRPLSPRGIRDAPRMGKRLRRRGIVPDLVLSSPARRAATTARLLTQELGLPSDCVHFEKALYDADISTLYDLVYTLPPDYDHVAIVGHNPTVHWFCLDLTHAPIQTFVTCAVADIALAVPDWSVVSPGTGRLLEFLTPKDPPDPDAG